MQDDSKDAGAPRTDAGARPASASRWARARIALDVALTVAALGYVVHAARAVTNDDALPHLDRRPGEVRFGGLDLATRRSIYETAVSRHAARLASARTSFPNHVWSQYDHYANLLHQELSQQAYVRRLHYTQVLLVFDEGVRAHWRSSTGDVIPATWEPLHPRTE